MPALITLDILTKAIVNRMQTPAMREETARDLGEHVLNFFGFQDRIIDNMLDPEDRDAFYMLEDVGILRTEREETALPDGREWRIHYWLLRHDRILKATRTRERRESRERERSVATIYDEIPDDVWFRRKPREEPEEEEEDEIDESDWETPYVPGMSEGPSEEELLAGKKKGKFMVEEDEEEEEEK